MLLGLDVVVVVETVLGEHLLDLLVRAWRDLINHRPGEGDLRLILQVGKELGGYETVGYPLLCVGEDTSLHLVAIVGAVVHRLNGEGQLTGIETLEQQGADLTHGEDGFQAACQVGIVVAVTLLSDGEGDHLQRGVAEDLYEAVPVVELRIGLEGFRHTGDDFLLDGTCALKRHEQREVVVWGIGLVDDFEVEGLCHDDTTIVLACVQGVVEDGCGEGTEDVTTAEVYPCGLLGCFLTKGFNIKLRELVAFGFPLRGIIMTAKNIIQFHIFCC